VTQSKMATVYDAVGGRDGLLRLAVGAATDDP